MFTVSQNKKSIEHIEHHIIGLYETQPTSLSFLEQWSENEGFKRLIKKKQIPSTYGAMTSVLSEEGRMYYFIGLGKKKNEQTIPSIRTVISTFFKDHHNLMYCDFVIYLDTFLLCENEVSQLAEVIVTSRFKIHDYKEKTNKVDKNLSHIYILTDLNKSEMAKQLKRGEAIGVGVNEARHFMNIPASLHRVSDIIHKVEVWKKQSEFEVDVLNQTDIEELGMGGLVSVANNSGQLLCISYTGCEHPSPHIGLIGCGVIELGQPLRKVGAAICIAVLCILSTLKPKVNVSLIMPVLSETKSLIEGEIVCSYQGKTIEITNKDEKEKLLLADAITFAKLKGAAQVCSIGSGQDEIGEMLGDEIIPMFVNDQNLQKRLEQSAENAGETLWALPNYKPYRKLLKTSHLADVTNGNGAKAISLTTGLFLQEFAEQTPWVHFNLEATGWRKAGGSDSEEQGGTGKLVRTLAATILSMTQNE